MIWQRAEAAGEPRRDHDVAATLDLPPDGPLASHNDGTTDGTGCVDILLPVNESLGESVLYFFDGVEVAEVSTIVLVRATIISSAV